VQDSEKEQDIEVEKQEFQNLLNAYYNLQNLENIMNANEYILIDKDIEIRREEFTDEDIINLVKSDELEIEEQQEEPIKQKVSISEAMNSLNQIMAFINNPPSNFTFEIKDVAALNNIKSKISSFHKNSKKQTSLDSWLK
jgi:hypothetical protein